jgi:enterochelin esterase-like enzyme
MRSVRRTLPFAFALLCGHLLAQDARTISPQVGRDRRVTFRVNAPQAKDVALYGNWSGGTGPLPLKRGGDGVWTATVGPLPPQIYTYTFGVDGLRVPDPVNARVATSPSWGLASLVEVPGDRPDPWTSRPVPAGALTTHFYSSHHERRGVIVYTPPGYEKGLDRYPVLYLLHGFGDDESAWTNVGRAHLVADNLLADGKIVPAIIVMPNAHVLPPQEAATYDWVGNRTQFREELLEKIIPLVEGRYRVQADAAHRAIAGLSMGGGHALFIGLQQPDRFAWIASMSGGVPPPSSLSIDGKVVNRNAKLLWISCGRLDDQTLASNRDLVAYLKEHEIRHIWRETDGAHSWMVWRESLAELLPLLFRG